MTAVVVAAPHVLSTLGHKCSSDTDGSEYCIGSLGRESEWILDNSLLLILLGVTVVWLALGLFAWRRRASLYTQEK